MAYVKVFPRGNTPEDRDKALEQALKAFKTSSRTRRHY